MASPAGLARVVGLAEAKEQASGHPEAAALGRQGVILRQERGHSLGSR